MGPIGIRLVCHVGRHYSRAQERWLWRPDMPCPALPQRCGGANEGGGAAGGSEPPPPLPQVVELKSAAITSVFTDDIHHL